MFVSFYNPVYQKSATKLTGPKLKGSSGQYSLPEVQGENQFPCLSRFSWHSSLP